MLDKPNKVEGRDSSDLHLSCRMLELRGDCGTALLRCKSGDCGFVIPQHIVITSMLFIAMQDLVGEDKVLEYDLAGDQQSLGGDGPRVGGEMTFAAALW